MSGPKPIVIAESASHRVVAKPQTSVHPSDIDTTRFVVETKGHDATGAPSWKPSMVPGVGFALVCSELERRVLLDMDRPTEGPA